MQQTALHWAAVKGSVEVADLLLQRGARIEAVDVNGYREAASDTVSERPVLRLTPIKPAVAI